MPAPALSERDLTVLRSFARRIDPSDAGAHNNLGVLYYQKGLIEEAIVEFARALELDSKMQVAQTNLEIAYRDSGNYDRRIAELSEAARSRPQDRTARWELGRAYATVGRHDEAVVEFEALLAHHPKDVPTLIQLGLADKARGRLDAASEWLARACAEEPSNAVARFHHGEVLYNRGLSEAALASLKDAITRNPDYAEAHYLLAFVYGDLGQHEAARASTKRAVALNPMLARAQANLALGLPALSRKDPDRYALMVLNAILGRGMSSRLFKEVRERRGLAYSVGSSVSRHSDTGMLAVSAGVSPENLVEAVRVILAELEKLVQEPVGDEEMTKARDYTIGSFRLSLETSMALGQRAGENLLTMGEIEPVESVVEKIAAVDAEDVLRVARRVLVPGRTALAVVGPDVSEDALLPLLN